MYICTYMSKYVLLIEVYPFTYVFTYRTYMHNCVIKHYKVYLLLQDLIVPAQGERDVSRTSIPWEIWPRARGPLSSTGPYLTGRKNRNVWNFFVTLHEKNSRSLKTIPLIF